MTHEWYVLVNIVHCLCCDFKWTCVG